MLHGFAAHLILMPHSRVKSAIALVDEQGILQEIRPLNRETPFTRFYDGALLLLRSEATPANPGVDPSIGERVAIWQLYPYDLLAQTSLDTTRSLRIL